MNNEMGSHHEEGDKSRLLIEATVYAQRMRRGQSSMLLIVIVIMIFVGLAVFLLGIANTATKNEVTGIYVNNLLLAVMRTDTGYTDSKCKLVSDLVFCAYFTPEWQCGPGVPNCLGLANSTIAKYMSEFWNESKSMKYLFTVSPAFVARDPTGEPISLDMGDSSLKRSKTDAMKIFSYPLVISKTVGSNQYTLKIQLIVSKR